MITGNETHTAPQRELPPSVDTTGKEMEGPIPQPQFFCCFSSPHPPLAKPSPKPEGEVTVGAAHPGQLPGLERWAEGGSGRPEWTTSIGS